MESGEIADLVVFIVCVSAFLLYHWWYFCLRGTRWLPHENLNLWSTNLKARSLWAHVMMSDKREALAAVHTVRNLIISVSLLAAAQASLIAQLLNILTDPTKLEQMEKYAASDPITKGDSFLSPEVKVALALGDMFLSLLLFAQCVRISVHLGFLIRIVPENMNACLPFRETTFVLMQRASLFFALGIRCLFGFVPLAFYMTLGCLALLVSTVILIIVMLFLDVIPTTYHTQSLLRSSADAVVEASSYESPRLSGHCDGAGVSGHQVAADTSRPDISKSC
ncbi:hypothetical protein M9434_006617 [Picochlorum sp. BPE23]|nr:hypothetical protein M9434_006617 [Picochlorum sp. BPE23]